MSVLALIESVERMPGRERAEALPRLDGDLTRAAAEDMAAFMGEVVSALDGKIRVSGRLPFLLNRSRVAPEGGRSRGHVRGSGLLCSGKLSGTRRA